VAFVRVSGLRKLFGRLAAVDDVSFSVTAGHTLALLGPSGCGKTTILRCLAGLENADAGVIEIAGKTVFDAEAQENRKPVNLKPEQRDLGVVFQSYAVWPHMTVAENVGFPLKVRRRPRAEIAARASRILDLVGLAGAADKPATALSGGQQQRVALARALVHEPSLVLFDEPMSNLDARLRTRMRMELAVLQEKLGFTAIYVTHDQAEAFALAETVAVMNHGRIETAGEPREVFARPQTPFVAEFLGFNVNDGHAVNVLPRADGFHVEVALADGFRIWGVQRGATPVRSGQNVLACSRKEHIAVAASGSVPAPRRGGIEGVPDEQTFMGVAQAASFLGLEEEYVISVHGIEMGAIQKSCGLRAGEPVAVTIRCEDVIVFAAKDGDTDAAGP
jgi:iron(III) transport system ATP-binding protein